MHRIAQAIFYGLIGFFFIPLLRTLITLPALLLFFVPTFVFGSSLGIPSDSVVSVPFIDWDSRISPLWLFSAHDFSIFAVGGFFIRGDKGQVVEDIRLLSRFCRQVTLWTARGALFCCVWGAILGAIWQWKSSGGLFGALLGCLLGTLVGEFIGLWIGAVRGCLVLSRPKQGDRAEKTH